MVFTFGTYILAGHRYAKILNIIPKSNMFVRTPTSSTRMDFLYLTASVTRRKSGVLKLRYLRMDLPRHQKHQSLHLNGVSLYSPEGSTLARIRMGISVRGLYFLCLSSRVHITLYTLLFLSQVIEPPICSTFQPVLRRSSD
jgi:hypothetical protein